VRTRGGAGAEQLGVGIREVPEERRLVLGVQLGDLAEPRGGGSTRTCVASGRGISKL